MQQCARGIGFAAAVLATIVASACGGDSTPNAPDTPNPSGPSTIRAADQIGWDQAESSWARLGSYTFLLYVDGALQGTITAQCSQTASSRGFPCTARLPSLAAGAHSLQLNAIVNGRESGLSVALDVTVQRSTTSDETSLSDTAPTSPIVAASSPALAMPQATVCTDTAACFSVQPVVTTDRAITGAAVTPDGRLLFVENGESIRVRTTRGLETEPAFVATSQAMRIVDVAVDPTFATTQSVHVAWIDDRDPRRRTVNVSRFRMVDNRLGQEAAIIVAVPLPAFGHPQIAQDSLGRLYLAMPSAEGVRSARDAYEGALLRFTSDGTVPWDTGQTSPVLARGPAQPLAMSVGANGLTVWFAGRNETTNSELLMLEPRNGSGSLTSPGRLTSRSRTTSETPSEIVAVAEIRQSTTVRSPVVVADDRGALWLVMEPSSAGQLSATRIPFTYGKPLKLTSGLASDIYVIAVTQAKSTPVFGVLRLVAVQNRPQ